MPDEAFLLRKPSNHIKRHGLARLKYPGWRRGAVGRNENAEGEDIEKDAEPSAPMNYAGDRDEFVLAGHRTNHVRTIHALSRRYFFRRFRILRVSNAIATYRCDECCRQSDDRWRC